MPSSPEPSIPESHDGDAAPLARAMIARALSCALADPRSPQGVVPRWALDADLLAEAWRIVSEACPAVDASAMGIGELPPARVSTCALSAWLALSRDRREWLHQRVFGLVVSRECPPYETEYSHWKDPTYRATQLADVAGFYRAFALEPGREFPERHDHISLELEFAAYLIQKGVHAANDADRREIVDGALRSFTADHLVWWAPTFARCLERRIARLIEAVDEADVVNLQSLSGVSILLRAWIGAHRLAVGVDPSRRLVTPEVDNAPPEAEGECGRCASAAAC